MSTVSQIAVPRNALILARSGDARALLSIPEAREDIPRLIAGVRSGRVRFASEYGNRKALAAAKNIMRDRLARREAHRLSEQVRTAEPGRVAKKAEAKARGRADSLICQEFRRLGYRTPVRFEGLDVHFGRPGAVLITEEGWIDYKRHGYRRGIVASKASITIPRDWEATVYDRDLETQHGMLTLQASLVEERAGVEIFAACWVRQGRGTALETQHGWIARSAAGSYHSTSSAAAARSGLRRKLTIQGTPPAVLAERRSAAATARAERQSAGIARLVGRLAKYDLTEVAHVEVSRRDSIRSGNCEPGTDQFIDRFFPERSRDATATIGEIAARAAGSSLDLRALSGDSLTLARQLAAACLVAIRRDKQARRALGV